MMNTTNTTTIVMPQLGETVTEGTITRWLKRIGDVVEKYEAFAEVATDKVNAEIPSPVAGRMTEILVQEGETVPTGAPIAVITVTTAETASLTSNTLGQSKSDDTGRQHAANTQAPQGQQSLDRPDPGEASDAIAVQSKSPTERAFSPAVRRALREHHLDPRTVVGTGEHGRVTLADVEAAALHHKSGTQEKTLGVQRLPLSRARRAIADHLVHAVQNIPHAWTMIEVDVSALVARRHSEREHFRNEHQVSPTYFHYFAHAVVATLLKYPLMNARFAGDAIEIFPSIDLAFAIALNGNLVVPVIREAELLSFAALASAIAGITERARSGRLSIDELHGGTITINNTGANGSILSAPIINGGQAAIITMESIVKRPVVVEGEAIAIRSMMNVCCSIDHRVIDGDVVGSFLRSLKTALQRSA